MEGTLQYISGFRSRIGVQQNRLEHTADNESNDWEGFLMGLRAARFEGTLSFETAPVLPASPPGCKIVVEFSSRLRYNYAITHWAASPVTARRERRTTK